MIHFKNSKSWKWACIKPRSLLKCWAQALQKKLALESILIYLAGLRPWPITIYGHLFSYFIFPGNPTIDYLSLDIEGAEYQVLNTIPYDQIDIKVISIETKHGSNVSAHLKKINRLMKQNGYKFWKTISVDDIYVKRDLFHTFMKDELWKNLHNIWVS